MAGQVESPDRFSNPNGHKQPDLNQRREMNILVRITALLVEQAVSKGQITLKYLPRHERIQIEEKDFICIGVDGRTSARSGLPSPDP